MVRRPTANRMTRAKAWFAGSSPAPVATSPRIYSFPEWFSACSHIISAQKQNAPILLTGIGGRPFTAEMRVRAPLGVPFGSLAQLAERLAVNQDVAGSNPAGAAKAERPRFSSVLYCFARCRGPETLPAGPHMQQLGYMSAGGWEIAIMEQCDNGSRLAWKAGVPSEGLQVRALSVPPPQYYLWPIEAYDFQPESISEMGQRRYSNMEQCDNW